MKNAFNYFRLFLFLGAISLMTACDDDAPEAENESETITTLGLTFVPQNGGTPLAFTAKDADGAGSGSIVIDNISLSANMTYTVAASLLNELESPAENITVEVFEEADEHRIFYEVAPASLLTVTTTDQDSNNLPLGLATTWVTGEAGTGTVTITLKHQPDGIKTATSTINDGETDVTVTFPVTVQ